MNTFPDRMGSDGISGGAGDPASPSGSCADASSPSVSPLRAAIPIADSKRIEISGRRVDLAGGRSVFVGQRDDSDDTYVRFTNGAAEETDLRLSPAATVALAALLAARGIEARRAETQRGSVEDESPVPEGNAP